MDSIRFEYSLDLTDFGKRGPVETADSLSFRPARRTDKQALAELMFNAYQGTIDYDGEQLEDSLREVEAYLAGLRGGQPLVAESCLAFDGPQLVGACLAGEWDERGLPIIAYIMTHPSWKNRGLGKVMLSAVLHNFYEQGHRDVRAVITEGNIPSERLFLGLGFKRLGVMP
jgi:RimJ/RimL family protein N-acetyltransferase